MPRSPRLDLPGVPQHVIQRGNDRRPCFFAPYDFARYRFELRELSARHGCAVHAYVLMSNHVHLLVTADAPGGVSRLMQSLGRRYVRYVNDRHGRTGTLWEGRFKACLVDSESYVMACYRYIELNPVRAGIVAHPSDYVWSSYRTNAGSAVDPLVQVHACYTALGSTPAERRAGYSRLVAEGVEAIQVETIRRYTQRQHALGSAEFQAVVEAKLGRRATPARIGRPRMQAGVSIDGARTARNGGPPESAL